MPSILRSCLMYIPNRTCLDLGEVFEPKGENLGGRGGMLSTSTFFFYKCLLTCLSSEQKSLYLFLSVIPS